MATPASPRNGTTDTRHAPMVVQGGDHSPSEGALNHKDTRPMMDVEMHDSDMSVPSFAPRSPAPSISPSEDDDDYYRDYNVPSPRPEVVTNVEGAARGTTANLHMSSEEIDARNRRFHGDAPMPDVPAVAPVCHASFLGDAVISTLDVPWVPREFSVHSDQDWKLHAAVEAVAVAACDSISKSAYLSYVSATTAGARPEGASPTSLNWARPPRRIKFEPVSEDALNGASQVETRLLFSIRRHANTFATAAVSRTNGSHSSADELDTALFDICGKMSITQLQSVAVRLQLDRLGARGSVAAPFAFGQEGRQLAAALVLDASASDSGVSEDIIRQRLEKLVGGTLPVGDSDKHQHDSEATAVSASIDHTLLVEITKTLELCGAVVHRHPNPPLAAFNQCVHSLESTILRVKGQVFDTTADCIAGLNALRSALNPIWRDHRRALLVAKEREQAEMKEEEELKAKRDESDPLMANDRRLEEYKLGQAQRSIVLDQRDPDGKLEAAGRKSLQLIRDSPHNVPVAVPSFNFTDLDRSNCNTIECYPNGVNSEMKSFPEVLNDAVAAAGTNIDAARAAALQLMNGSFELIKRRIGGGERMLVRVSHGTPKAAEPVVPEGPKFAYLSMASEISLAWFNANFSMPMPGLARPGVDGQTVDIVTLWLQSACERHSKCRPDLTTDMSDGWDLEYAPDISNGGNLYEHERIHCLSLYEHERIHCLLQRAEKAEVEMHRSRRTAAPSCTGVLALLRGSERVLLDTHSDVDAFACIIADACGDDIAAVVRLLPISSTPLTLSDELIALLRKLDGYQSTFSARLRTDALYATVQADMDLKVFFDWPSIVHASRKNGWVDADAEALGRCLYDSDFKMLNSRLLAKADVIVALNSTLELLTNPVHQPHREEFFGNSLAPASTQVRNYLAQQCSSHGASRAFRRSSIDALRRVQLRPGAACFWNAAVTKDALELLGRMDSIAQTSKCPPNFYTSSAHKVVGLQLLLRHSHSDAKSPGIQCTRPGLAHYDVGVEVPACPPKFYRRNGNEPPGVLVLTGGCGAGKTVSIVAIVEDVVDEIAHELSEASHGTESERHRVVEGAVFIVVAHVANLAERNTWDLEKIATAKFNGSLNVVDSTAAAVSKQWAPRVLNYKDLKGKGDERLSVSQEAAAFQLERGGISVIFCTAHSLLVVKKRVLQISAHARVFTFQDEIAAGLSRLHDPTNGARYQRDLLEYWRNVPRVDSALKAHVVLEVIMCATFAYDPERGGVRPDLSGSICGRSLGPSDREESEDPPVFSGLTIPTLLLNLMDETSAVDVAYIVGMTTGRLTEQDKYPTVSVITGSDSAVHALAFMVLLHVENTDVNAKPPSSCVAMQPPTAKRVNADYRIVELTKAKLVSEGRACVVDSAVNLPIISATNTKLSLSEKTNYATSNRVLSGGNVQNFANEHHAVSASATSMAAYGNSIVAADKEVSASIIELPSEQPADGSAQFMSRLRGRRASVILARCPAVAINTEPRAPFQDGAALAEAHKQERTRRVAAVDLGSVMSDNTNAVLQGVQQCRLPNPHNAPTALFEILDIAAKISQRAPSLEDITNRLRQQTALVPQWVENSAHFFMLQYTGGVEPSLQLISFFNHIIHIIMEIKVALKTEKSFANSIMPKLGQFSKYTAESDQPSSYRQIGGNEKMIKEISDEFVQRGCRSESMKIDYRARVNEWISRLQETHQFNEVQAFVQKGKSMRGDMQDEFAYDTTIAGAVFLELAAVHVSPTLTKNKFPVTRALLSMRCLELTLATLSSEFDVSAKHTHEQLMAQWDDTMIALAASTALLSTASAGGRTEFTSQNQLFETLSTYDSSVDSDLDIGLNINTNDDNGRPISYMHAAGKLMQSRTKANVITVTMRLLNVYIVSCNGRLCIRPSDMRPVSFACAPMDVKCAMALVSSTCSRKRKRDEETEKDAALAFLLPSATPPIIPDDMPFVYDCALISTSSDAANDLLERTLASDKETGRDDMGLLFPMGVSHQYLNINGTAHELKDSIEVFTNDLLQRVADALARVVPDTLTARTLRARLPVDMPLRHPVRPRATPVRPHATPAAVASITVAPTIPLHSDAVMEEAAKLEAAVKRAAKLEAAVKCVAEGEKLDDSKNGAKSIYRPLARFLMQNYVPFSASSSVSFASLLAAYNAAHSSSEETNQKALGAALLKLGIPRCPASHRSAVHYSMLHAP